MTRINLGERNELSLSIQAEDYKEKARMELVRKQQDMPIDPNEAAKREMALELMQQGFSCEVICRILNISVDQMLEIQ